MLVFQRRSDGRVVVNDWPASERFDLECVLKDMWRDWRKARTLVVQLQVDAEGQGMLTLAAANGYAVYRLEGWDTVESCVRARLLLGVTFDQDAQMTTAENDLPISGLGISERVRNVLRARGIERVSQVLATRPEQLLEIRNFGPRALQELRQRLVEAGYTEGRVFSDEGLPRLVWEAMRQAGGDSDARGA